MPVQPKYCRNRSCLSGAGNLGSFHPGMGSCRRNPRDVPGYGCRRLFLYVGAGLVDPRKRICGYCSLAGYRVFLPRFHIPESGIPEIRRVGHPVLDCHYNVPDRSSVLRHQPAETSGNDDHTLFCRYDRFVTGILYSDQ